MVSLDIGWDNYLLNIDFVIYDIMVAKRHTKIVLNAYVLFDCM